jgi:hypothetical protein
MPLPSLNEDVLRIIFSYLVPADSILLGLTCRTLYLIHRQFHGPIELIAFTSHSVHGRRTPLYRLLKDCWAPDLVLVVNRRKFVKRDIWEKEPERARLEAISEYVIAKRMERISLGNLERG